MSRSINQKNLVANLEQSIQNLVQFTPNKYLWVDFESETILPPTDCSTGGRLYRTLGNLYAYGLFSRPESTQRDDVLLVDAVVNAYCNQALLDTTIEAQTARVLMLKRIKGSLKSLQSYYAHDEALAQKYYSMQIHVDGIIQILEKDMEQTNKAIKLETSVNLWCEMAVKATEKEKQVEDIKGLSNLVSTLNQILQYVAKNPVQIEIYRKMLNKIQITLDNLKRVVDYSDEKESIMNGLLSLDISDVKNTDDYEKALGIIKKGFIELYRESAEGYDQELIKDVLIRQVAFASQQGGNAYIYKLISYINQNLATYMARPSKGDNLLNKSRGDILDNAASILVLPEDNQGGHYMDGNRFVHHKLKVFQSLYGSEMTDEQANIIRHMIEQTSDRVQKQIYDALPVETYEFTLENYQSKQYFPEVDSLTETNLKLMALKFLRQFDDNDVAQKNGIIFPAGFSGHYAPIAVKLNSDGTYQLVCANAGAAATGEAKQVESSAHAQVIQTDDTVGSGNGKVLIGEVVTEYGPYSLEEILDTLVKLARLKYMKFNFKDLPESALTKALSGIMKNEAFKSIFDEAKKVEHNVLNQQTFQVIGNCFVKNIDLLIKDSLATHVLNLKQTGKLAQAKKAEDLLNIYHKDLMVRKQSKPCEIIPEKKPIHILGDDDVLNAAFNQFRRNSHSDHVRVAAKTGEQINQAQPILTI